MNGNDLRYLVMSEGGATALLATALARPPGGQVTAYHQSFWRAFAEQLGLDLTEGGPRTVLVEDGNLDLVLLWDDWCIVVEVKVRSGSVRDGQLQEYYDLLRRGSVALTARFPHATKLCLAFLVPANVGIREFESLVVTAPDHKAHLKWEDVLAAINAALDSDPDAVHSSFFQSLLRTGADRLTAFLGEVKARSAVVVTDEQRLARRGFALDVQAAAIGCNPDWADLFRPLWTAPSVEEIYLALDSSGRTNVYFTVFSESVVVPDGHGPCSLNVRFWFKVANKHRAALRDAFAGLDRQAAIAELRLTSELATVVQFDGDALAVVLRTGMDGERGQLVVRCAQILERFIVTFQRHFA